MKNDRFVELSKLWLQRANDDILWANDSFATKHFSGVCFLSQQIAEKALKAYLFHQKQKLIRTHDLERLLEKCLTFDKDFLSLKQNCQILNDYYIDTRYPDIWDIGRFDDEKMAQEALSFTKEIYDFVAKKLEK